MRNTYHIIVTTVAIRPQMRGNHKIISTGTVEAATEEAAFNAVAIRNEAVLAQRYPTATIFSYPGRLED